ncbi:MAG: SMP-30/gluconolactonase/LRE family protein [Acetobacteraceae bacterium]
MANDVEQLTFKGVLNGESPLWNPDTGRLVWIDVRGPALHEFDPATGTDRAWDMPAWIGACYRTQAGLALTLRTGLFDFDPASGALAFRSGPPFDACRLTFNDGRCDRQGRLFAGPMMAPLSPGTDTGEGGPLWRYDGKGKWAPISQPVHTSNGLAWSPDGRVMYHADTRAKTVWAYDYDPASGAAANRRVFATADLPGAAGPDGAAVDCDGFYWVAVFGGACLLRFDPAGTLERRIDLPIRYPTMPAFGGAGLDAIYVTSANHTLSEAERAARPHEGCLFRLPAPVPGLTEAVFDGEIIA